MADALEWRYSGLNLCLLFDGTQTYKVPIWSPGPPVMNRKDLVLLLKTSGLRLLFAALRSR
jgi:hypothetical protein